MVEDVGRGIAHVQKNAEQRTVFRIVVHTPAQGLGVFERSQRAVDPADHFAQRDFLRRPLQLVTAVRSAEAVDDSRPLEIQKDRLQKLFRQLLLGGDVLDLDDTGGMLRKHRQCS